MDLCVFIYFLTAGEVRDLKHHFTGAQNEMFDQIIEKIYMDLCLNLNVFYNSY